MNDSRTRTRHYTIFLFFLRFKWSGFPKYYVFMGGTVPPVRGDLGLWWGTLAYRNQISVKPIFVCSTHTFHKNVCFTVCLNSTGVCDSAMVNVGC